MIKYQQEVNISLVILDIKDDGKGKFLLDFLKQIDFLEIREGTELTNRGQIENNRQSFEEMLLNAPVLSEEEILNIEHIGKEFSNWKIVWASQLFKVPLATKL